MKLNIFLVTYEGDKRREERWETVSEERKKKTVQELNHRFMKRAGFEPVETSG